MELVYDLGIKGILFPFSFDQAGKTESSCKSTAAIGSVFEHFLGNIPQLWPCLWQDLNQGFSVLLCIDSRLALFIAV